MNDVRQIFVRLLGEGVDVWRPVQAQRLGDDLYLVLDQQYDRDVEQWQFEPGSRVLCEQIQSDSGLILAATRSA
ncbi:MAG: hypothetical protein KF779_16405 [Hyphomonadaceae bacterium]|nr:hypothetical protein [Hyphomonadaceae bacterium]